MVLAITRGDPRPSNLDSERERIWSSLENDISKIKAKGGIVDASFEIPDIGLDDKGFVGKGGPGSGNFGHEGRPGEVGGSGAGGGFAAVGRVDTIEVPDSVHDPGSVYAKYSDKEERIRHYQQDRAALYQDQANQLMDSVNQRTMALEKQLGHDVIEIEFDQVSGMDTDTPEGRATVVAYDTALLSVERALYGAEIPLDNKLEIEFVRFSEKDENFRAQYKADTIAQVWAEDGRLQINLDHFENLAAANAEHANAASTYFHPVPTIESSIHHEIGHLAQYQVLPEGDKRSEWNSLNDWNAVAGKVDPVSALGMTIQQEADMGTEAVGNAFRNTAQQVSTYATKNPKEFVAEVYAGMMSGKEYPAYIRKMYEGLHGPKASGYGGKKRKK